ncbi:MAG: ABC transporter substrate-binding protein [Pseudomonadota bacterium]
MKDDTHFRLRSLSALALATTVALGTATPAAAEDIQIGFAAGLTGYLAFFDGAVLEGAEMAVAEINAAGGIEGLGTIELIARDMRSETAAAAVVARELVAEGVSALLVPCDVDPAIAVGQIAARAEIPMIAACASTPILAGEIGPYMFQLKTADTLQAAVLADYAIAQGYETAHILLSPDTPYTDLLPQWFAEAFEARGGSLLGTTTYAFDQQNFTAEATAIAALDPAPDVVMTSAYEPHFPAFITALRAAGSDVPVLGSDGIDSPTTFGIGDPAEGVVFSMAGFPAPGSDLEAFYRAHEAQYGDYEPFAFSATGYEAIQLFAAAMAAAGSTEGPAVRDALDAIVDFDGVTGTTITFAGQDRIALRDVTLVEVAGGEAVSLGQFAPDPATVPSP